MKHTSSAVTVLATALAVSLVACNSPTGMSLPDGTKFLVEFATEPPAQAIAQVEHLAGRSVTVLEIARAAVFVGEQVDLEPFRALPGVVAASRLGDDPDPEVSLGVMLDRPPTSADREVILELGAERVSILELSSGFVLNVYGLPFSKVPALSAVPDVRYVDIYPGGTTTQ